MNMALNKKIAPWQVSVLLAGFILGSSLLTSFMDVYAKHDAWLVILSAYAVSVPFIACFGLLCKRFPGKNLIQILECVYGPIVGKVIAALYIFVFMYLLSLNTLDVADFYHGYIMPEVPRLVFLALPALVAAYAVHQGIEAIARLSLFALITTFTIIVGTILLLLGDLDLTNFLPVAEVPPDVFVQSTHIFATISFGEVMVFMMIIPSASSLKKAGKSTVAGLSLAALGLLLISLRNTAALGPSAGIINNATYDTARLIDIGEVLTRIEFFLALGITFTLFIKICVLYYATVHSIAQLCRLHSARSIILPVGMLAVALTLGLFDSIIEHHLAGALYQPFFLLTFEAIIPPVSLLVARVRKLPRPKP
jgi:spore germination protein KB